LASTQQLYDLDRRGKWRLTCYNLVGRTGFEPVTSSVSGKVTGILI
jgi:hypothetical protein